jgi:hypothetical protein
MDYTDVSWTSYDRVFQAVRHQLGLLHSMALYTVVAICLLVRMLHSALFRYHCWIYSHTDRCYK